MAAKDLVLNIMNNNGVDVTDSRDVAKMIGKAHKTLIRDIKKYIDNMGTDVFPSDFFIESIYLDKYEREKPCFLITKKGCEFIAHKLTGKKGTEFTAKYVEAFNEMQEALQEVETTVQKHGALTESEWNKIKKKSKYLTENIHSGKSTREYIKGCDLMHLQEVIDEIYEIAKPCRGEIRYEILNNAIKTLKEISSQYDYSNPMSTFIKTVANDGVIKLQSIHTEKLVRETNNKDKKISSLKSDIEALNPPMEKFLNLEVYGFSFNDMYHYYKNKVKRTKEYNEWLYNFPYDKVAESFKNVDLKRPSVMFVKYIAPESNDIDNFVKSTQDAVAAALGCNDNKIHKINAERIGYCDRLEQGKILVYIRNLTEEEINENKLI